MKYIGIDIGGTKCAVIRGSDTHIEEKRRFETSDFSETLACIMKSVEELIDHEVSAIGVSCGGPLDAEKGIIQSPPNLPSWDNVPLTSLLSARFHLPAYLCNDADACALAEWQHGAGRGTKNMIFCTFGTGFGAGLILDDRLYQGSCGGAGEIGHVALHEGDFDTLHIGYFKSGSVEGYCSGGGIAQYGYGSAKELADLARTGSIDAINLWRKIGEDLGKTLAILIDLFNPEAIVLGGIYPRTQNLMEKAMREAISENALKKNAIVCRILPAELGESIGDIAALSVAKHGSSSYLETNCDETESSIDAAVEMIVNCYRAGGKVFTAGNGGSAADAEHIVGELMKGFLLRRTVNDPRLPQDLACHLQGALPAICLSSGLSLPTAFGNDCDSEYTVAQTLYGLGKTGDVAILISTSGNAKNLIHTAKLAKAIGVKTILLTGRTGGMLRSLCDISICAPVDETYRVQEYHLPIYHKICFRVEADMFPSNS